MGVTDLVSETERVENYLEFEKLGHVHTCIVQHGLQGYIVKNIKDEATEATEPSHSGSVA